MTNTENTVNKADMNELVTKVENWATDKGLEKASSDKQFLKVAEEFGEIGAALARQDRPELIDGIGDTVVTLIILALQEGLTLQECLQAAYTEIADRKGKMVDGVFVKESDLKKETEILDTKEFTEKLKQAQANGF